MPRQKRSTWDVDTGKRICTLRHKSGLTQQDVAGVLDCTYQMVQKIEKGSSKLSAEHAVMLATVFRVGIHRVLGIKDKD